MRITVRRHVSHPARAWCSALVVAFTAVGCGGVGLNANTSPATPATLGASASADALTAGFGTRTSNPTTYDAGTIRFDPAPVSYSPTVSAAAAYQAWATTGGYANAVQYSRPTVQLAAFTDYGQGTHTTNGQITLTHVQEPVWVITFVNVPDAASGGAVARGEPTAAVKKELHNIVAIVDANTQTVIEVMSDLPDPSAYPPRRS